MYLQYSFKIVQLPHKTNGQNIGEFKDGVSFKIIRRWLKRS